MHYRLHIIFWIFCHHLQLRDTTTFSPPYMQVGTALDTVEQLVEEQSLDILSADK